MLAWGIAPGIRLFGNQALKTRFSLAHRLGRCMEPVSQVSRAFSAEAFAVLQILGRCPRLSLNAAPGAAQM
jgi:hypothetical protein